MPETARALAVARVVIACALLAVGAPAVSSAAKPAVVAASGTATATATATASPDADVACANCWA